MSGCFLRYSLVKLCYFVRLFGVITRQVYFGVARIIFLHLSVYLEYTCRFHIDR